MNEMDRNNFYSNNVTVEQTNGFVRKVLLNMVLGILITAIVPVYCIEFNQGLLWKLQSYINFILIGQVILVLVLSMGINKMSTLMARMMFFLYAFTNGIVLSGVSFVFGIGNVLYALAITMVLFLVTGIYGYTTHEDLTKYSKFLMGALITIIIVSIINFFIGAPLIYWGITVLGVVIFSALIAYDINRIKNIAIMSGDVDGETLEKIGIIGALNLYLDFINLFLYVLRLVSRKK